MNKQDVLKIKTDLAFSILKDKYSGFYQQLLNEAQDDLEKKITEWFGTEVEGAIYDSTQSDSELGVNVGYGFEEAEAHINNYNEAIEIAKSLGE